MTWEEVKKNADNYALIVMRYIEYIGEEREAEGIINEYMTENVLGHIPCKLEINDFIWNDLPNIMDDFDIEDYSEYRLNNYRCFISR